MNIIMSRPPQHQYPHYPPPPLGITNKFIHRIPLRELTLSRETLGSGSFGTVFKGRWRGRAVAVKQFKTQEEINSFMVEVKQLSCVKHENIVTLYGTSSLADTAYLIMEYAEGGSLNHLLHECKQQNYDLRHACIWALQAARGVAYLHGMRPKPIMHRDLKPANLLLFSRGRVLKICDFGTACAIKTQMTNNTGSASYMAPEVFATSSYLESGDVFSWSIIFWEILARMHPYSQHTYSNPYQILWRVKQDGIRPAVIESCPVIIWTLITRSWHKDPKQRPSMQAVSDEMELIYKLTRTSQVSSTESTNISTLNNQKVRQLSPHIPPICSPYFDDNREMSSPKMNTTNLSSCSSEKDELRNQSRFLRHRLEVLKKRAEELRALKRCDKWDTIDEFENLKKETVLLESVLEHKQSSTFPNHRQAIQQVKTTP